MYKGTNFLSVVVLKEVMTALDEFLGKLKDDPNKHLQEEFSAFLREFKAEQSLKNIDIQSFMMQDAKIQEDLVKEFLLQVKKTKDQVPTLDLSDFVNQVELGNLGKRQEFETFLKSWTDEEKDNVRDFESFADLTREEQENIFAKFQEDELPDVRPKQRDDVIDIAYTKGPENTIKYHDAQKEQSWNGQHKKSDEPSGSGSTLMDLANKAAQEPDRYGDEEDDDPWGSTYR